MNLPRFAQLGVSQRGTKEERFGFIKNSYSNPPGSDFRVRDLGYLAGAKKVKGGKKRFSPESAYTIVGINVFRSRKSMEHVASKVASLKRHIEAECAASSAQRIPGVPEFLVVTWMFKGTFSSEHTCVVHLFRRRLDISPDPSQPRSEERGFERAFHKFLAGDAKVRRNKLKFEFQIREAPTALRKTIKILGGERPVLIGKALTTKFFDDPAGNYMEIDHDVSSSTTASLINGSVLKTSGKIIVDTSWLIEAQDESELPEMLLGTVRWRYVSLADICIDLDENFEPHRRMI